MPADQAKTFATEAGGVELTIVLPADNAIPGMAQLLESLTSEALARYSEWIGPPPTEKLDITAVPLDSALGISWSGSVWLDLDPVTEDGQLDDVEREGLRFVVYHELAHQWIANLVGTNSNDHTFLTEGLANTIAVATIRDVDGPEAAQRVLASWVAGPYRAWVNGGSDAIADTPASELEPTALGFVVYGKAGLGFEAIRQQIGDDAFRAALRSLATDHRWGIVTPDDVRAAFEQASEESLDELWSFWFEEKGATIERIDVVVAGAG
jgi:aminopeptidase N